MTRKSEWPKGTDLQVMKITIPRRTWAAAKIQAVKEERTLQELVTAALNAYARDARKKGGSDAR